MCTLVQTLIFDIRVSLVSDYKTGQLLIVTIKYLQELCISSKFGVVGKDGAIMSLSEENARLTAELDSLRQTGDINGSDHINGDDRDTQQLQATIRELTSHVCPYYIDA